LLRAEGVGSEAAVFRSNVHCPGEKAGEQQLEADRHRASGQMQNIKEGLEKGKNMGVSPKM
jgi:hypothetical protein